jgi:phosphotransferase system  glucose/maltose/N-acetylglucosamine-specific IIC component
MSAPEFDAPTYSPTYPPAVAQAPAPAPVAGGLQMKHRNPLGVWIGLPLITLGIYSLVWLYKIHSELGVFDRRRIVGAVGPVLAWIFGGLTLMIWPLVSTYNTGGTIAAAQRSAGLAPTCSGGLGVLLVFVFGTHSLYYQLELNRIVAVNPVPEGTQVPLWV